MDELIPSSKARLLRSLTTSPDLAGWMFAAGVGLVTLSIMGGLGFATGLYALTPPRTVGVVGRALTVLFVPALGEEAVFRGLLIPDRTETDRPWPWFALMTGAFVLWHVAEGTTFLSGAKALFLRWDFLACAAILGLGCGITRWRTGSLWPAVGLHWLMVMIWQTDLGGLTLDQGRAA
jgi:predicted Abi (CAAX) family protease